MVSAVQLAQGKQQFTDASGVPLNGGTVAFFVPGTSTPSNTWQDSGLTTLNTNPVTLDSAGRAIIFGQGNYRQLVKDSLGNTIWDQVVVTPISQVDDQNGAPQWGGTSTGAANVYNVTLNPPLLAYVAGQRFAWFTHQANTGAAVVNFNGLGAKSITKNGSTALASGDIANAAVVEVILDPNLNAELMTPPGSLQVTAGTGLQSAATTWSMDPSYQQGGIGGLGLSFNSTTVLNIASGFCVSDDVSTQMKLASAFTKTTGAWAVGTGNGGLDTGSVANNTWYAVFIIERTDTGVVDVIFTKETAASTPSPTLPASYTKKRYIGSFKTEGTASILSFSQNGDEFLWAVTVADASSVSVNASSQLIVLTVPLGVKVNALFHTLLSPGAANFDLLITSPDETDQTITANLRSLAVVSSGTTAGDFNKRTNTSGQIRIRGDSATAAAVSIGTYGWVDTRGKNA